MGEENKRPLGSVAAAKRIVGGLSRTSKMPCDSWGIPAQSCRVGGRLARIEGTVCHGCYALRGAYAWRTTQQAYARRLACAGHPEWVEAMQVLVSWQARRSGESFFRWFDSGDLQSGAMLERIVAVAAGTPEVQHWLPTREYALIRDYVRRAEFPANLTVRVSAHHVDGSPPRVGGLPTSTVHTAEARGYVCPAYEVKPASCGSCRACWDPDVENVSYSRH